MYVRVLDRAARFGRIAKPQCTEVHEREPLRRPSRPLPGTANNAARDLALGSASTSFVLAASGQGHQIYLCLPDTTAVLITGNFSWTHGTWRRQRTEEPSMEIRVRQRASPGLRKALGILGWLLVGFSQITGSAASGQSLRCCSEFLEEANSTMEGVGSCTASRELSGGGSSEGTDCHKKGGHQDAKASRGKGEQEAGVAGVPRHQTQGLATQKRNFDADLLRIDKDMETTAETGSQAATRVQELVLRGVAALQQPVEEETTTEAEWDDLIAEATAAEPGFSRQRCLRRELFQRSDSSRM